MVAMVKNSTTRQIHFRFRLLKVTELCFISTFLLFKSWFNILRGKDNSLHGTLDIVKNWADCLEWSEFDKIDEKIPIIITATIPPKQSSTQSGNWEFPNPKQQ